MTMNMAWIGEFLSAMAMCIGCRTTMLILCLRKLEQVLPY
jgi:hypothetical protein